MPLAAGFLLAVCLVLAGAPAAPAAERCDGCGMLLAGYGRTLHRVTSGAGEQRTFCGFTCMAEALGSKAAAEPPKIEVADYQTGAFVDARKAIYVEGSDAPPVMGAVSMVAFGSAASAAEFRRAHGGAATDLRLALERQRTGFAPGAPATRPAAVDSGPPFVALPRPGKKIPLDADHSFVFSFDKRPAMETVIVKIELFTKDDRRDTSLEVKGNADMPSMGCQAGRPDRSFVLNKKGDYLLPFTFGMPGGWEVYFTFLRGGTVVYRGKYAFEI